MRAWTCAAISERRHRLPLLKAAVFLACLAPLAALFARGLGIGGATLGANPVEFVLHTLGTWGLNFLLLTLAVSPLRAIIGRAWPLRLRRMLGLFAFFYATLHLLCWLVLDQGLYLQGIVADIAKRPFITIGALAYLLLVPLAVTSTDRMLRRLGRRWKTLHRLVYVVVLLGVWHYYWLVKADVRAPLLYLAVALLLLGWRVRTRLRRARP